MEKTLLYFTAFLGQLPCIQGEQVLPGSYKVGDFVVSKVTRVKHGEVILEHGDLGRVMGPSPASDDPDDEERVMVSFNNFQGHILVRQIEPASMDVMHQATEQHEVEGSVHKAAEQPQSTEPERTAQSEQKAKGSAGALLADGDGAPKRQHSSKGSMPKKPRQAEEQRADKAGTSKREPPAVEEVEAKPRPLERAVPRVLPGNHHVGEYVVSKITHQTDDGPILKGDLGYVLGKSTDRPQEDKLLVKFPRAGTHRKAALQVNIYTNQIERARTYFVCGGEKGQCKVVDRDREIRENREKAEKARMQKAEKVRRQTWSAWLYGRVEETIWVVLPLLEQFFIWGFIGFLIYVVYIGVARPLVLWIRWQRRSWRWIKEAQCVCNICTELVYPPITLDCGHTLCKVCLERWVLRHSGKFSCPVGGACPEVAGKPVQHAEVNQRMQQWLSKEYPVEVKQRRRDQTELRRELAAERATIRLVQEVDGAYLHKRELNVRLVEELVYEGADTSSKSGMNSSESLVLVVLNNYWSTEDSVRRCIRDLVLMGGPMGDAEFEAFMPRWASAPDRSEWRSIVEMAGVVDALDERIASELHGFLRVGDRITSKIEHFKVHKGLGGFIIGPAHNEPERRVLAYFEGQGRVNILPSQMTLDSDTVNALLNESPDEFECRLASRRALEEEDEQKLGRKVENKDEANGENPPSEGLDIINAATFNQEAGGAGDFGAAIEGVGRDLDAAMGGVQRDFDVAVEAAGRLIMHVLQNRHAMQVPNTPDE